MSAITFQVDKYYLRGSEVYQGYWYLVVELGFESKFMVHSLLFLLLQKTAWPVFGCTLENTKIDGL